MSKKTYMRNRWMNFVSRIYDKNKRDVLIDNISIHDVGLYIDLGFTHFSGSFSEEQLLDRYGDGVFWSRRFDAFKFIVVDPLSGIFKYSNNESTNDMDIYGFTDRYGDSYHEKVMCLAWGVVEKNASVYVKIKEGNAVPFIHHKLFYVCYPDELLDLKYSYRIKENHVRKIKIGKGQFECVPYHYACVMNLLRDYVVLTPSVKYENGTMSRESIKAFIEVATLYVPSSSKFNMIDYVRASCTAFASFFVVKQNVSDFKLFIRASNKDIVHARGTTVKIVDLEPMARLPSLKREQQFIEDVGLQDKDPVILDANTNSPSSVANMRFLRHSHVSCRDADVKMYVPQSVLKDYKKVRYRKAHNSQY